MREGKAIQSSVSEMTVLVHYYIPIFNETGNRLMVSEKV
jgi:hypothetical protein